jgi:hypothetical protein
MWGSSQFGGSGSSTVAHGRWHAGLGPHIDWRVVTVEDPRPDLVGLELDSASQWWVGAEAQGRGWHHLILPPGEVRWLQMIFSRLFPDEWTRFIATVDNKQWVCYSAQWTLLDEQWPIPEDTVAPLTIYYAPLTLSPLKSEDFDPRGRRGGQNHRNKILGRSTAPNAPGSQKCCRQVNIINGAGNTDWHRFFGSFEN